MAQHKMQKMKSLVQTVGVLLAATTLGACTVVDQGDYSISKGSFSGNYEAGYKDSGMTGTLFKNVYEINGREILIDVGGIQPKDKDSILLKDMNLTITYKVNPKGAVDFVLQTGDIGKYEPVKLDNSMGSEILGDHYVIGYNTMKKETSTDVQKVTRDWSSMDILNNRDGFEKSIVDALNKDLKEKYGNVFEVLNAKTYTIKVGDTIEGRIQAIAAAQTATAKANAEMAALVAQKGLMLQEAMNIADVAKQSGMTIREVIDYQTTKAIAAGGHEVLPTVEVKSKGPN